MRVHSSSNSFKLLHSGTTCVFLLHAHSVHFKWGTQCDPFTRTFNTLNFAAGSAVCFEVKSVLSDCVLTLTWWKKERKKTSWSNIFLLGAEKELYLKKNGPFMLHTQWTQVVRYARWKQNGVVLQDVTIPSILGLYLWLLCLILRSIFYTAYLASLHPLYCVYCTSPPKNPSSRMG